jgi:hypothetical protein
MVAFFAARYFHTSLGTLDADIRPALCALALLVQNHENKPPVNFILKTAPTPSADAPPRQKLTKHQPSVQKNTSSALLLR